MSATEQMEAQMILGEQFERFVESDLGRYLTGRAEQKVNALTREMRNLDPLDPDLKIKLAKIQSSLELYEDFLGYIRGMINEGRDAFDQYNELQTTD